MRVLLFLCIFAPLGFLGQIGVNAKLDDSKSVGPSRRAAQFVPNVPEECLRKGICENVSGYPEEHVAALIKQLGNATDKYYRVDELDTSEIMQRDGSEDIELCDFSLKVVVPQAAPDKDGNWHFILNPADKPLQAFQVEICDEDKSPCTKQIHFDYSRFAVRCKQKYMMRFMAGMEASGEVMEKAFKLPSCCSCVVGELNE